MRQAMLVVMLGLGLVGWEARAQVPKTEDERALYALGQSVGRQMEMFDLTPEELEWVRQGMLDAITGTLPAIPMENPGPRIQGLARRRQARVLEKKRKAGAEFVAQAAKEKGAITLPGGGVYQEQEAGKGAHPMKHSTVVVNYRGTLLDGTEFDSSYARGTPATFPLGQVIRCWTEGMQKMKAGGKARLVCPPEVAYGAEGSPPSIPPHATLIFDVELLQVK